MKCVKDLCVGWCVCMGRGGSALGIDCISDIHKGLPELSSRLYIYISMYILLSCRYTAWGALFRGQRTREESCPPPLLRRQPFCSNVHFNLLSESVMIMRVCVGRDVASNGSSLFWLGSVNM